ncbi:fumarylacetoacetate hydrolase family protein [Catenovulum agarivorans]|uniref:fumarylacetoacetate hydrolase family protein n=1 Tax=Catenovulum agarivorans TaxID=1172192 RepID=UPI00031B98E8|nr:fumarylacetoacetate hydrolase family protein [Catenovulum agarivorans]
MYQHLDINGKTIDLPLGKVVCLGGNYADHIKEMSSLVTEEAVVFMKPSTALVPLTPSFAIPTDKGACHNETEIAVLIQSKLCKADEQTCLAAIWGLAMAQDLTLRDVQKRLKSQGRPWERAKAFDASCPVSAFIPMDNLTDIQNIDFSLAVNGEIRQASNSANMERSIAQALAEISQQFTLLPGDIVLTGTPAGVANLNPNDQLTLKFDQYEFKTSVLGN